MGASVDEMLKALEAKKSPFISMMEGMASGYYNARQHDQERALNEIKIQREREGLRYEKMLREAYEQELKRQKSEISTASGGMTPQQKVQTVISANRYGPSIRQVLVKPQVNQARPPSEYFDPATGAMRRGYWDSATGRTVSSESDPITKQPTSYRGSGARTGGTASERTLHNQAYKNAMSAYTAKYPNKYDMVTGKYMVTQDDVDTEEFKAIYAKQINALKRGAEGIEVVDQPDVTSTVYEKSEEPGFIEKMFGTKKSETTRQQPSAKPIVQYNKKTGQKRISNDGGKTWRPYK